MFDFNLKRFFQIGLLLGLLSFQAQAIQVSPSYQIFEVKAGRQVKGECEITNNEDSDVTVKVHSKDWFVLPENKAFAAPAWLVMGIREFQLKKGEKKTVPFTVKVPEKAVGELVGMVSMEFAGDVETMVKQVVSVAVYASVTGTEKLKADLEAMMVTPSSTTLQVGVQIRNVGNVHVRPIGQFWIYDEKNRLKANINLQQGRPTYPDKTGEYYGQIYNVDLTSGSYEARILLQDVDRKKEVLDTRRKFTLTKDNKIELTKP